MAEQRNLFLIRAKDAVYAVLLPIAEALQKIVAPLFKKREHFSHARFRKAVALKRMIIIQQDIAVAAVIGHECPLTGQHIQETLTGKF